MNTLSEDVQELLRLYRKWQRENGETVEHAPEQEENAFTVLSRHAPEPLEAYAPILLRGPKQPATREEASERHGD